MMLSGKHILIVEDDPHNVRVFELVLKYSQAKTSVAMSAEDALTMLERHNFDAVLIDLALPKMDGWGLLEAIRKYPPAASIPCVAVTAFGDSTVEREAIAAGFDGYFAKPIDHQNFAADFAEFIKR